MCPPGFHLLVVSAWADDGPTDTHLHTHARRTEKGFLEILFETHANHAM